MSTDFLEEIVEVELETEADPEQVYEHAEPVEIEEQPEPIPEPEPIKDDERQELSFYRESIDELRECQIRLGQANSNLANAKATAKAVQEELNKLVYNLSIELQPRPLIEFAQKNESRSSNEPQPVEPNEDAWKSILAKDELDLTENELNKLATDKGIDSITLEDIEQIRVDWTNGKKIKGVGKALMQKLDDQMIEFWAKHQVLEPEPKDMQKAIEDFFNQMFFDGMHYETFCERIDSFINEDKFEFAYDTLDGMRNWAYENEHVTQKMIQAANNIYNGAQEGFEDWEE